MRQFHARYTRAELPDVHMMIPARSSLEAGYDATKIHPIPGELAELIDTGIEIPLPFKRYCKARELVQTIVAKPRVTVAFAW